jgi:acetyl-CoA acyltransferase
MARFPAISPTEIDDVIAGCAFPEGEQGLNLGRVLALGAGFPVAVSGMTVNRFCSSGLQSIADATAKIRAGWASAVIAGGCETMSHIPLGGNILRPHPDWGDLPNTYTAMGITAENVAERYLVSRKDQDFYSLESHRRAFAAVKSGLFGPGLIPVNAWRYLKNEKGERAREQVLFAADEGVRWPAGMEDMERLKSPFREGGTVTAGNSSQMADGAAFALLMNAARAESLGLKPLARLTWYAAVGCPPEEMGIGPALAIPKVLQMAGMTIGDIDVFEINEAFAAQVIYCIRALGIEDRWRAGDVNPHGGAIALGHPLGATGAMLASRLLYELKRRKVRRGIVAMCVGGGMGTAGLFEMLP